jgi:pyruvate/2-oxoglutarate dehydrogenase complex dihydrolipoamide acyltransferase (E2) component
LRLPPLLRSDGDEPAGASATPRGRPSADTVRRLAARAAEMAVAGLAEEEQRDVAAAQVQSVLERLVLSEQVYVEEAEEGAEEAAAAAAEAAAEAEAEAAAEAAEAAERRPPTFASSPQAAWTREMWHALHVILTRPYLSPAELAAALRRGPGPRPWPWPQDGSQ